MGGHSHAAALASALVQEGSREVGVGLLQELHRGLVKPGDFHVVLLARVDMLIMPQEETVAPVAVEGCVQASLGVRASVAGRVEVLFVSGGGFWPVCGRGVELEPGCGCGGGVSSALQQVES